MSKLPGIAMVIAGVGVATYALPWTATGSNSPDPLDEIQAPQVALKVVEVPATPAWQTTYAPAASEPVSTPPRSSSSAPPKRVAVAEVPPRIPVAQAAWGAAPTSDRASLAREIQRHLKRVGCYDGEVNGVWSPSSRRAMKSFTDRMNATLPTDEPDFVLLAMVESHGSQACGRPCAPGQSDDSRCVPSTVVTAGSRIRPLPSTGTDGQAVVPPAAAPLDGRMALAGPKAETAETGALVAPAPNYELSKAAPRVDKSSAAPQRRDRQRNRSATNRSFPAWARSAFGM